MELKRRLIEGLKNREILFIRDDTIAVSEGIYLRNAS
jgi:hypothetical protein